MSDEIEKLISELHPSLQGVVRNDVKRINKEKDDWLDTSKACNLGDPECEACQ